MKANFVYRPIKNGIPFSKRVMDIILVVPALLILSPLMGMIALWVCWVKGSPVLFKQKRPGYQGKIFKLYKFRTMREALTRDGHPLPDEQRLTRWGIFLRATSLDELPEMINILRGEMSLVGPRPLLVQYLERYSPEQARRHEVLPGLTGWAQINGRNSLSWEDKFRLDVWYVDHRSIGLDLKILWMTIWKVIRREGISQPGQATAEEFMGSPPIQKNG